jgi:hypothetical protein
MRVHTFIEDAEEVTLGEWEKAEYFKEFGGSPRYMRFLNVDGKQIVIYATEDKSIALFAADQAV